MKTGVTPEIYRIMRVYTGDQIQHRQSVLRRATDLPRETLGVMLNTMVRDGLVTVRAVNGDGGSWDNLYTLTTKGRDVVEQTRTRKRADIRYRI